MQTVGVDTVIVWIGRVKGVVAVRVHRRSGCRGRHLNAAWLWRRRDRDGGRFGSLRAAGGRCDTQFQRRHPHQPASAQALRRPLIRGVGLCFARSDITVAKNRDSLRPWRAGVASLAHLGHRDDHKHGCRDPHQMLHRREAGALSNNHRPTVKANEFGGLSILSNICRTSRKLDWYFND